MEKTKIYLTRHGETEWNTLRRMQGHMDSPLTEMGKQQGQWLSERLKTVEIDHIYSSPSGRAMQTSELINVHKGLKINASDHFKEIFLGNWEGRTTVEIESFDLDRFEKFWHNPEEFIPTDGESFQEIIERTSLEMEAVAKKHEGQTVLIVAHAVVLKSLIAYVENKELKDFWKGPFMNSTCLNCFEKDDSGWTVTMLGDTSHFPIDVEPKWVHPK
jgi:broad specificity phosphatase PhoE